MADIKQTEALGRSGEINKITVYYRKVTFGEAKNAVGEGVSREYTERLIIDGETDTLEHVRSNGCGEVACRCRIDGSVEQLLQKFDAEKLFSSVDGNAEDVVDIPNEMREYTITVDYRNGPPRVITGSYDKHGLPTDFADFAQTVKRWISTYGMGEILDARVYEKVRRRRSEHIFCRVIFNKTWKGYYYLTDDDSIKFGDYVIVPVGKDNDEEVALVINVEYFSEDKVPHPIEKTKRIIRKANS